MLRIVGMAAAGVVTAFVTLSAPAAQAQLASCEVGQAVAVKNFRDKWIPAVIVAVDPGKPYPCRVHPLGYTEYENSSWAASMLKPRSAATEPPGGLTSDPYLQAAQGQGGQGQATVGKRGVKPGVIVPGLYECYALTSGHLSPRLTLNINIVDASHYRDAAGGAGTYTYDAGSGAISFSGAGLNGQRATYSMPANPPTARNPATITYVVSGDSCDLKF